MNKVVATILVGTLALAGPAAANHIFELDTPFPSRGACEAEVAALSQDDRNSLLDRFPQLFSNRGEVASFLTRAFPCELDPSDGQWYISDHRQEVFASDWFKRRLD